MQSWKDFGCPLSIDNNQFFTINKNNEVQDEKELQKQKSLNKILQDSQMNINQNSNLDLLIYDSDKSYPIQISSDKQNTNMNDKTK